MKFSMQPNRVSGLCVSCRESQVIEHENGRTVTLCHYYGHPIVIARPVLRCNQFDDKKTPSEFEMQKIAWTLRTDQSGLAIGFKPPEKKAEE